MLISVENFRVIDLFDNRMNTVFKSYFQVWILVSLIVPVNGKLNLFKIVKI